MGLHSNMRSEPVSRLALRTPVLLQPGDTVRAAVEQMRAQQLGCVFVVDADRKPTGIFTEHMLNRILITNVDALDDPLREHMEDSWCSVKITDEIVDVLAAMQAHDVRFVCVLDEQGRVAALTGQKGLMEYIADHFPDQVMVQRIGCSPYIQQREGA